jgi:hypothetical protein
MLNWLVEEKGIAPHIPVFDKSKRDDGTFSRSNNICHSGLRSPRQLRRYRPDRPAPIAAEREPFSRRAHHKGDD